MEELRRKISLGSLPVSLSSPSNCKNLHLLTCPENRAVTYTLKPNAFTASSSPPRPFERSERLQYGFIAQEVESLIPEVISEDAQGFKAVAYSRLVPIVASALGAALDRLDALEQRWDTVGNAYDDATAATAAPFHATVVTKSSGGRALDSSSSADSHGSVDALAPLVTASSTASDASGATLTPSSVNSDGWRVNHGGGARQLDCKEGDCVGAWGGVDDDDAVITPEENKTPPSSTTRGRASWSKAKIVRGGDKEATGRNSNVAYHRAAAAATTVGVSQVDGTCDRMQLLVENTALRGRVGILEERLEQLEHAVADIVRFKTSAV